MMAGGSKLLLSLIWRGGGRRWMCKEGGVRRPVVPSLDSTYFDLFGLPSWNFDVDTNFLAKRHRKLQQTWHPDQFQGDEKYRKEAMETSARINAAYDTLRKPHLRAKYMLELEGISLEEDESKRLMDDPQFLEFVMCTREALEDNPSQAILEKMGEDIELKRMAASRAACNAFRLMKTDEDYKYFAKKTTAALQYLDKIAKEIIKRSEVK